VTLASLSPGREPWNVRGVNVTVDRSRDVDGLGGRPSSDELRGVYRERAANVVIAVVLVAFGGLLGLIPAVLVFRRAVIVSSSGLEARRLFSSWRVPWSAIESFAIDGPPDRPGSEGCLTVVLADGSTRSAWVGSGRRRDLPFTELAAAAQRHSAGPRPWPSPSPHERIG
jgi:hypothetical protein